MISTILLIMILLCLLYMIGTAQKPGRTVILAAKKTHPAQCANWMTDLLQTGDSEGFHVDRIISFQITQADTGYDCIVVGEVLPPKKKARGKR